MPAMVVDDTRIRGTDASVDVRHVFGETYSNITMLLRRHTPGSGDSELKARLGGRG